MPKPSSDRYLVMLALLTGILIAAWLSRRYVWRSLSVLLFVRHLAAGVVMGLGGAMAMGGNDAQLLLGLPGFSPAAMLTVVFMLRGIYLGGLLEPKPILSQ